jgi:hypothetical protein
MRTCFEAIKNTTEFLRRKGAERKSPKEDDFVVADHIALLVPDRRIVHQVAEVLQKVGFRPLFAPEEHPEFDPGYYSVSFCDPDNNVIESYTKIEQSSAHVQ